MDLIVALHQEGLLLLSFLNFLFVSKLSLLDLIFPLFNLFVLFPGIILVLSPGGLFLAELAPQLFQLSFELRDALTRLHRILSRVILESLFKLPTHLAHAFQIIRIVI